MYGCMALWLCGCMAARLYGCMTEWLYECMNVRLQEWSVRTGGLYDYMAEGLQD